MATQRAFDAVERDDVQALQALLLPGNNNNNNNNEAADAALVVSVDAIHPFDDTRPTLLHRACARGHVRTVRALLQWGAHPSATDYWGFTPLHKASDRGHWKVVQQLVLVLLNNTNSDNSNNSINAEDYNKSTPLVWAAWRGHLKTVQVLLKAGALSTANGIGNTPLHVACKEGRCEVVAALLCEYSSVLEGDEVLAMLTAKNDDQETPLDRARTSNHPAAARQVLHAYGTSEGMTLHAILQSAQYEDGTNNDDDKVQLPIGTLDANMMHHLLQVVLAKDPGAIRGANHPHANESLPLGVACATGAPIAVINFLLRTDPDVLLFL